MHMGKLSNSLGAGRAAGLKVKGELQTEAPLIRKDREWHKRPVLAKRDEMGNMWYQTPQVTLQDL